MTAEPTLKSILRIVGTFSLFGLLFVVAPHGWMNAIHGGLGLGELPTSPIVGYLARSTSALYALLGGLFWTVSLEPKRHTLVLNYLGVAIAAFGAVLLGVDVAEGLPALWTIWEGPFVMVFGVAIHRLNRAISRPEQGSVD